MNNKKGFTIVELMVVICIMGILAAVAVPKLMGMKCKSDIKACKEKDIELYNSICSQDRNYKICFGEEKSKPKEVVKEVVHDTVYVVVDKPKKDTISMPLEKAKCILQCQKDNVSKSLIDFCIKEKCK
jgi:prepilin-type N-terminal cleavage/methylation domain-containing protein